MSTQWCLITTSSGMGQQTPVNLCLRNMYVIGILKDVTFFIMGYKYINFHITSPYKLSEIINPQFMFKTSENHRSLFYQTRALHLLNHFSTPVTLAIFDVSFDLIPPKSCLFCLFCRTKRQRLPSCRRRLTWSVSIASSKGRMQTLRGFYMFKPSPK